MYLYAVQIQTILANHLQNEYRNWFFSHKTQCYGLLNIHKTRLHPQL